MSQNPDSAVSQSSATGDSRGESLGAGAGIPAAQLAEAEGLYRDGWPVAAWQALGAYGAPQGWRGAAVEVFGSRLLAALGAERTAVAMQLRLLRRYPAVPRAVLYGCYGLFAVRGPLAVLDRLQAFLAAQPRLDAADTADIHALLGRCYGCLKDTERAASHFATARAAGTGLPWILCEEACVAEAADDVDAAIALCQESLRLSPGYHPAATGLARLLLLRNRDEEAHALLYDMAARTQWAGPLWIWQQWLSEQGKTGEALAALEAWEKRSPLLDTAGGKRLAAARSSLLLEHGDFPLAAQWAAHADSPFHRLLAERGQSAAAATARRVQLPVGFVRQNDMTCAPATLTMLAGYWGLGTDHLELAGEICYDGTPGWKQRRWVEQQGWCVREFTVTPAAVRALIDAGAPFALATVEGTSAHLQAVIGYDDRTGCLIIRDPNLRHHLYFPEAEFYSRYAAWGPRGMVFAPRAGAGRFTALDLPDAALYDVSTAIDEALDSHRRADAGALMDRLEREAPGHRVTLHARLRLHLYDHHPAAGKVIDELLRRYPDDRGLTVMRFRITAPEETRARLLRYVRDQAEKPGADSFWRFTLADLLTHDGRCSAEASALLRRLGRRARGGELFPLLAAEATLRADWPRVLDLRRLSACLQPRDEDAALQWYAAARSAGRAEEVVASLRRRWECEGRKDPGPALTLARAVRQHQGPADSLTVITDALRLRPDDGLLMLAAVPLCDETGSAENAAALLAAARGRVAPDRWHRAAALREERLGRPAEAAIHWRGVLTDSPLDIGALSELCRLTEEMDGPEAAVRVAEQARASQPAHTGLRRLHISLLRTAGDPRASQVLEAALSADPDDGWCRRELAMEYQRQHRMPDALATARQAVTAAPQDPQAWAVLGAICTAAGDWPAAQDACTRALALDPEVPGALAGLHQACPRYEDRRAALDGVLQAFRTRGVTGPAIAEWAQICEDSFTADEQITRLRALRDDMPHLWHAHAALVNRLAALGRHADAGNAAERLCGQFPGQAESWAAAAWAALDGGARQHAGSLARRALQISPAHDSAWHVLASLPGGPARTAGEMAILREWLQHSPRNALPATLLADALWLDGARDEGWALMEKTVFTLPGFADGWNWLCSRAAGAGQDGFPARVAALAARYPHRTGLLAELARAQAACGHTTAADATLLRAVTLHPADVQLHRARVLHFMNTGRTSEALDACRPADGPVPVPAPLVLEEARILHFTRRSRDAVALVEALAARCPDDPDVWLALTGYTETTGQWQLQRTAAQKIIALAPGNAQAFLRLGWIHIGQARDSSEAAAELHQAHQAFQRAREISPADPAAMHGLLECCLLNRRLPDARALLAAHRAGLPTDWAALFDLIIGFRADPDHISAGAISRVIRSVDLPEAALYEMHRSAMSLPAAAPLWHRQLDMALAAGHIRSTCAMRCWAAASRENCEDTITKLGQAPVPQPLRDEAWDQLCWEWLDMGALEAIEVGRQQFPDTLRVNDRVWTAVTMGLGQHALHERLFHWTADWRDRRDAGASPLALAGEARMVHKGLAEALPVWALAVERAAREPDCTDVLHLRCDLAVGAAISGKFDHAEQLLRDTPVQAAADQWHRDRLFSRTLAEALIAAGKNQNPALAANLLRQIHTSCPGWQDSPTCHAILPAVNAALQRYQPQGNLHSKLRPNPPKPQKSQKTKPPRPPANLLHVAAIIVGGYFAIWGNYLLTKQDIARSNAERRAREKAAEMQWGPPPTPRLPANVPSLREILAANPPDREAPAKENETPRPTR